MISIEITQQPNDYSCGPSCLHSLYRCFGDTISLDQIIREMPGFDESGTLGVFLALHALKRGYSATIYSYNLNIFDLSWKTLNPVAIRQNLQLQMKRKTGQKFRAASKAYQQFLDYGGKLLFDDLSPYLFHRLFSKKLPILAGLSATYLYDCPRESTDSMGASKYDDIHGYPVGHFVLLCGYDENGSIVVADPYPGNPISNQSKYPVDHYHLMNAILLGIVTYDANIIVIEPEKS